MSDNLRDKLNEMDIYVSDVNNAKILCEMMHCNHLCSKDSSRYEFESFTALHRILWVFLETVHDKMTTQMESIWDQFMNGSRHEDAAEKAPEKGKEVNTMSEETRQIKEFEVVVFDGECESCIHWNLHSKVQLVLHSCTHDEAMQELERAKNSLLSEGFTFADDIRPIFKTGKLADLKKIPVYSIEGLTKAFKEGTL